MSDETPTDDKVKAGDCGTPKTEPHTAEELKGTQATAPAQEIPASPTHETDDKPAEPSAQHDNQAIEDEGKPAEKPTTDEYSRKAASESTDLAEDCTSDEGEPEAAENENLDGTPESPRAGGPSVVVNRDRIFAEVIQQLKTGDMKVGGEAINNIYIGAEAPKLRTDPTEQIDPSPDESFVFDDETLALWDEVLCNKRVLTLTCYDFEILQAAGNALTHRHNPKVRLLTFGDDREVTLDWLQPDAFGWQPETVVVAHISRSAAASTFLDSVARCKFDALPTSAALNSRRIYLLLLTEPSRVTSDERLPCQQVPFVEPMLRASKFRQQASEWDEDH